jgi:hypothetical protein
MLVRSDGIMLCWLGFVGLGFVGMVWWGNVL